MADVIRVGASVVLGPVDVLFLDGNVLATSNLCELAMALTQAYLRPAQEEPLHDPDWARTGYKQLVLNLTIEGGDVQLVFAEGKRKDWADIGGPNIEEGEDDRRYHHSHTREQHPWLAFPGGSGLNLGKFFCQLARCPSEIWVHEIYRSLGPLAHNDYVAMLLEPCSGPDSSMAQGGLGLVRHTGVGDTYQHLFELEGGYSERGRGDHVGAYSVISHGL